MTSPLPDDLPPLDASDFDAWITRNLGMDDEGTDPAWQARVVPLRAKAVGQANPVRYIQVIVVPEFARTLYDLAAERGLSRESLVRLILVDGVARLTGQDRDAVLGNMPPRRKVMAAYPR